MACGSVDCRAADRRVDVTQLPRLAGAIDTSSDPTPESITYDAPGSVKETVAASRKLLADNGWIFYVAPLEDSQGTSLYFKKGQQGLLVLFTMAGGKADRSSVNYRANTLNTDLPIPSSATDVVFDANRPYLNCVAAGSVDAALVFFDQSLIASGWSQLSASDIAARFPDAKLDTAAESAGLRYYGRDAQKPVVLALQRVSDDKTSVEIKVAPFALPKTLEFGDDSYGLPTPSRIKSTSRINGETRRELNATIPAEVDTVLAFYRQELAKRNWTEQSGGAAIAPNTVLLSFSSPEESGVLKLGRKYDLTTVNFVAQVLPSALAARAKAKQEASDKFFKDAEESARALIAEDAKRVSAMPAAGAAATLNPLRDNVTPIPLPDTASDIDFDGDEGKLEFSSASSVQAVAGFFRTQLKALGWKSQPSVINQPNMAVMEFSKGQSSLSLTAMQLGPKVNVSATGSGLKKAEGQPSVAQNSADSSAAANTSSEPLEADSESALPVPKQHTLSAPGAWSMPGGSPFRRELDATVPANLDAVLAFYRKELTKREWKELSQGAVVKSDKVVLAFTSPDGPAVLKLGRGNGETSVNLVQKNPVEAGKAGIAPASGQVKVMFGNMGNSEAAISINAQTIKIAAGVGGPATPKGPTIELPPGKYKYALLVAGRAVQNAELEVAADDTWGLMVAPVGNQVMALQMY
ncbi:MAG: hypothetical protein K2X60_07430 [Xanthobacteraceae bacterium]|nr:hypothetical protein [Xanthobacteraceae bacterium]